MKDIFNGSKDSKLYAHVAWFIIGAVLWWAGFEIDDILLASFGAVNTGAAGGSMVALILRYGR